MRLWRILAISLAVETAALGLLGAAIGVAGRWNGWADAWNIAAPAWLGLALLGLLLGLAVIPKGRTRWGVIIMGGLGLLLAGGRMAPEVLRRVAQPTRVEQASAPPLTLVTFNAWDENVSPKETVAFLAGLEADVILMQERYRLAPVMAPLERVYPGRARCKGGRQGQYLILSKEPLVAASCVIARDPEAGQITGALWATVTAPDHRPATLATTHLVWPVPPARQTAQSAGVAAILRAIDGNDLILTGDFNLPPWMWRMDRQDESFAPLVRRTRALATWPARIPRLETVWPFPFLAIDHVYADPAWTVGSVERLRTPGSDHYAVRMRLTREPLPAGETVLRR